MKEVHQKATRRSLKKKRGKGGEGLKKKRHPKKKKPIERADQWTPGNGEKPEKMGYGKSEEKSKSERFLVLEKRGGKLQIPGCRNDVEIYASEERRSKEIGRGRRERGEAKE